MTEAKHREWLFDLGNTRLKFAPLHAAGMPGEARALAHEGGPDAWEAALPGGDVAYVSCVASAALREALLAALSQRFTRIHVARTLPRCGELRIGYAAPERLGVDRFLALLAAHARGGAALVVSVGTALTLDLLDGTGLHHGGRIAASPRLMRDALHARAAQLPAEGGTFAEFANDTADALASGCEGAALALVERSHAHAAQMLGTPAALLMHGGGAASLAPRVHGAILCPGLVLQGLARWARIGHAAP